MMPAALDRIYRIFQNLLGLIFQFLTAKGCEMRESLGWGLGLIIHFFEPLIAQMNTDVDEAVFCP